MEIMVNNNSKNWSKWKYNFSWTWCFSSCWKHTKDSKIQVKNFLGKFYNGLVSSPQKAFLDISLTQIRPVTVNVLGEALAPGPHLVNGLASVLNAIYSAGGIKTTGSLRKVLLYRNNKLIKEFDLYNYITKGKLIVISG